METAAYRDDAHNVSSILSNDPGKASSLASDIIHLLRLKGYIMNQKRLAFVAGICTLGTIEGPEEFWIYLKKGDVPISITSVYNNLRIMVREKLMMKNELAKGSSYTLLAEYPNQLREDNSN